MYTFTYFIVAYSDLLLPSTEMWSLCLRFAFLKRICKIVKAILVLSPRRAEAVTLNDCLQLSYLPSKRSHMLLLYPREILILDLELSQTVGVVAIERSGVPFIQVRAVSVLCEKAARMNLRHPQRFC